MQRTKLNYGSLYYNSYRFQLITHYSAGQTVLASHSSLRSLLFAHTKLRTTGLLTGWGKVMCLLACHLWGTGQWLAGQMERESSPVCHISPPHLIPATVLLHNNLLPKWKAKSTPAPMRGTSISCKTKGCWIHERALMLAVDDPLNKKSSVFYLLSALVICAYVR